MFKRIQALATEKGFTLIELLVTTTIIGVLAAVVTIGVSGASSSAQTKANQQLFNEIQSGFDNYAGQNSLATGVPVTGAVTSGEAANTTYFGTTGVAGSVTVTTSQQNVDFTSGTNSFNGNFRLNNSASGFKCVVANTATFTLTACRN